MRTRKTSSGDNSRDPYIYLHGIPPTQRTRLNGQIIRKGRIKGAAHKEVILIENEKIIFHGKQ